MTDMTAFERQLSGEITGLMGPIRPVDDAAIFTAITTTQSPKWRFPSMFSATKFVVAGAILALFGGFLLSGVLMQQPTDDRPPVVGASASATTQADPTEAASSEPEPTSEAEADDTATTPDLLPGVDLVTEEVAPGVYRVLSDGEHNLRRDVWGVAASSDGSVFVEKYRGPDKKEDQRILRLGEPGVSLRDRELATQDGGTVVALGGEDFALDGQEWALTAHRYPCKAAPDGSCWKRAYRDPRREGVTRVAADGDTRWFDLGDELGILKPKDFGVTDVEVAADGTVWVSGGTSSEGDGITSFDGEAWTPLRMPPDSSSRTIIDLEIDFAGGIWALHALLAENEPSPIVLSRWDGQSWSTHGPVKAWNPALEIGSDGTMWVGSLTLFDGEGFRHLALPSFEADTESTRLAVAHAPDGHVWVSLGHDGQGTSELYVITAEAVAAQ